jgi:hypothetical protein
MLKVKLMTLNKSAGVVQNRYQLKIKQYNRRVTAPISADLQHNGAQQLPPTNYQYKSPAS